MIKKWSSKIPVVIFYAVLIYIAIASMVFRFRNPWATDMQIWMNFPHVLMFQVVPER